MPFHCGWGGGVYQARKDSAMFGVNAGGTVDAVCCTAGILVINSLVTIDIESGAMTNSSHDRCDHRLGIGVEHEQRHDGVLCGR